MKQHKNTGEIKYRLANNNVNTTDYDHLMLDVPVDYQHVFTTA